MIAVRKTIVACAMAGLLCISLAACTATKPPSTSSAATDTQPLAVGDKPFDESKVQKNEPESDAKDDSAVQAGQAAAGRVAFSDLDITQDFRSNFDHGDKSAAYQKYIVLHDTEGDSSAASVIDWWDGNGNMVSSHFVINKDGSIWQCVDMDRIAHHAGFGDAGHNALYGVEDESRDDKRGTSPIGDWAPDYGMNSYSVGIEMVHVSGSGGYPEEQLVALDKLIAYIDAHYGFESTIIDHKMWRSGNSDTSPEFADYLANYIDHRTHN